ncbi:J domain-containing protein [Citrobacter freundii]|nr:DnaJ domain-containing protein [Citrobacter freundii]
MFWWFYLLKAQQKAYAMMVVFGIKITHLRNTPKKMRTHYDNLKVSMDAPIEVIQAAYRTLAKKYHPDKNKGNPDAERIMQIINTAYEVLSDPVKRAEHDAWIGRENGKRFAKSGSDIPEGEPETVNSHSDKNKANPNGTKNARIIISAAKVLVACIKIIGKYAIVFGIIIGLIKLVTSTSDSSVSNRTSSSDLPANTISTPANSGCSGRQPLYPDGRTWPSAARIMSTLDTRKGLSSLLLDNSRNNQDLWVKLVLSQDVHTRNYARDAFIPAHQQLKLLNVASGKYVVKMMNVYDGCAQVSPVINLEEIKTEQGIEYSDHSLTFYPVINGNAHLLTLPSSQF